jgi:hypothetical protein
MGAYFIFGIKTGSRSNFLSLTFVQEAFLPERTAATAFAICTARYGGKDALPTP